MTQLFKLIIIISYLLSCKTDKEIEFIKIDEIEFNIGYLSNHKYMGLLTDPNSKDDFFYFGDPTTHKKISFFDLEGNLQFIVPLKESFDSLGNIGHFEVISSDTIVVFGQYNNRILIINRDGHVQTMLDLNLLVQPYNSFHLTYRTTYHPPSIRGKDLLLHVEYMSKADSIDTPWPKDYFKEALDVPYFLKITDFTNPVKLSYVFGLDSFYRQFMNDSMAMSEFPRFAYINNEIVVISIFSDSIYFIHSETLNIKRKFAIDSEFSKISSKPIDLLKNERYQEYLDTQVRFGGHMKKIIFDQKSKTYIILIAWENKDKIVQSRNYSYAIYSQAGLKLDEITWDNSNYSPGLIYYFKGKYYISSTSSDETLENPKKIKFDVFELHI